MNLTVQFDVEEDGRIVASVPELPGVQMYGRDRGEVFKNVVVLAYQTLCGEVLAGERSAESLMRVTVDGPTPDKVTEAVVGANAVLEEVREAFEASERGDLEEFFETGERKRQAFVPHPDDLEEVRAGFEALERGEGIALTVKQVEHWAETGELPCLESLSLAPTS